MGSWARGFIDRKGNGVGSWFVTALRFTRVLSNGRKQKEKRRWTCYSLLDIKYHLRWNLSPLPVQGSELSQFKVLASTTWFPACLWAGHVSQGPFHSYGVRPPRDRWCTLKKQRQVIFDLPPPPTPESPTASNNSPSTSQKGSGCPGNYILVQSEAPSPWLVQAVCLPFSYYFRPWGNSHRQEHVMDFLQQVIL